MDKLHESYLPFSEEIFGKHFAKVKMHKQCVRNENHMVYYEKSIKKYKKFLSSYPNRKGMALNKLRAPCQIEKDERFWTAASFMSIFEKNSLQKRDGILINLLKNSFGDVPPFKDLNTWTKCLEGKLNLYFETSLPSPQKYKKWLKENLKKRQFIPFILDSAEGKQNLEGPTHVDAIVINETNGFAIIIEAKVLSDISVDIIYDTMRNQIARNIDVMLEKNEQLCEPLNRRNPERTLFLLVTPKIFKDNPQSRLYGYKFLDYKSSVQNIKADLPHRNLEELINIPERIGWISWEEITEIDRECCPWLDEK